MRGWNWTFADGTPALEGRLESVLEEWDSLETRPGVEVLKSNAVRTVLSVPATADHPALVVKRYHVRSWRERLKYFLVPSRAAREWDALRTFARGGVSGPEVLAMGEARRGGALVRAGLIMRRVEETRSLPVLLGSVTHPAHELLHAVGAEIGRMHAAGVDHTDLHAGNILVRDGVPWTERGSVVLLDLHATHLGALLPDTRRIENLAKLFHSLSDDLDDPRALALLDGYRSVERDALAGNPHRWLRRLERRARALENVRLASRSKRCWKRSSEFVAERRGLWRVHRRREIPFEVIEPYLLGQFELDQIYKDRPDQVVGSATWVSDDGVRKIVVKRRTYSRFWKRLSYCIIRGPLERAWGAARALDVRGVPNPQALALMSERRFGLPHQSILLTEHAGAAEPLHADLFERFLPPRSGSRRQLHGETRVLAQLVRRLHDTGIYHRDLNPNNVLIGSDEDGAPRFLLVDLDSIHLGRRLDDRRRAKNLVQLGLLPEGHITTRDRLRFLRDYDRGDRRFFTREFIRELSEDIADETVRILARMSRQEAGVGPERVGHAAFGAKPTTDR
ncbi:MAG: lipopolysaccharide kinase InaA family protein [Planctomycetota bacterium]